MKTPEGHPFAGDLVPSEVGKEIEPTKYGNQLLELKDNPNYIIRQGSTVSLGENTGKVDLEKLEEAKKNIEVVKSLERYGIRVAPFQVVVGKGNYGLPVVYYAVERIHGKNLINLLTPNMDNQMFDQVDQLYTKYIEYLRHISPGRILSDVKPSNFVCGKASGDEKDVLYFVDVTEESLSSDFTSVLREHVVQSTYSLNSYILGIEKKTGKVMNSARKKAMQFYRELLEQLLNLENKNKKEEYLYILLHEISVLDSKELKKISQEFKLPDTINLEEIELDANDHRVNYDTF